LKITNPHKAHKNHSLARDRENRAKESPRGQRLKEGNSKQTHWCEGEDLEEHLEQEQEPEEEELH
jgi:hypothetical protein